MNWARRVTALCLAVWLACVSAQAGPVSLLQATTFAGQRGALVDLGQTVRDEDRPVRLASLFAGQEGASLFALRAPGLRNRLDPGSARGLTSGTQGLLALIGQAEAGRLGYDAVQHGAVHRPGKAPTKMTIAEILVWIEATPGQPHAIGRYQFIPATLRRLVAKLEIGAGEVFAPLIQDRLAGALLAEAGFAAFRDGTLGRHDFMHNLAKVWAGLPTASGASHYDGYAGNKATMTWAYFDAEMGRIFPG